ncbi:MAG: hypothetical protein GY708_18835 [Actinomycetia bacterium]|nr:hypothetical protein [Actinomycetes bacterium]MCP4958842.1 hypothetical protein [Actinomycetes bacterium]
MREFVDRYGVDSLPHINDQSGDLWNDFGVRGQPAWIIVAAEGGDPDLVYGVLGEENFAQYTNS